MKKFTDWSVRLKLLSAFLAITGCLIFLGAVSIIKTHKVAAAGIKMAEELSPVDNATRDILLAMVNEETGTRAFLVTGQEASLSAYTRGHNQLIEDLKYLDAHQFDPALKRVVDNEIKPQTQGLEATFGHLAGLVRSGQIEKARTHIGDAKKQFGVFRETMDGVSKRLDELAKDAETEIKTEYAETIKLVIASTVAACLLSIGLSWLLARLITEPLGQLSRAASLLAQGDVNQHIRIASRDETGQLATSFVALMEYQKAMAVIAEAIATGDLTGDISPKSEQDTLGNAFAGMAANLRVLIREVSDSAQEVASASVQLSGSTGRAGRASETIAGAIQEVAQAASQSALTTQELAKGSEHQAHTATEAAAAMERLQAAITQLRRGGQQQQSAAQQADDGMQKAATSVEAVAHSARQMAASAQETAVIAKAGGHAVQQTISSMERIKEQMQTSAEKVRELSGKSLQIGAIVDTIDQIAEQTKSARS